MIIDNSRRVGNKSVVVSGMQPGLILFKTKIYSCIVAAQFEPGSCQFEPDSWQHTRNLTVGWTLATVGSVILGTMTDGGY